LSVRIACSSCGHMSSLSARAVGNTILIKKDRLRGHTTSDRNFPLFSNRPIRKPAGFTSYVQPSIIHFGDLMSGYLPASFPASQLACLPASQLACLPAFQLSCLPAFQRASFLASQLPGLPASQLFHYFSISCAILFKHTWVVPPPMDQPLTSR
jgi:hypothetical protein